MLSNTFSGLADLNEPFILHAIRFVWAISLLLCCVRCVRCVVLTKSQIFVKSVCRSEKFLKTRTLSCRKNCYRVSFVVIFTSLKFCIYYFKFFQGQILAGSALKRPIFSPAAVQKMTKMQQMHVRNQNLLALAKLHFQPGFMT